MKKRLVKITAVVLAVITLLCVQLPVASAASNYENDMPIVYVHGAGRKVYNEAGEQVYPVQGSIVDSILEESDKLMPGLFKGISGGGWETYCDALVEAIKKVYGESTLDENGNVTDGSLPEENTVKEKYENYTLSDYVFNYDNRLDPCEIAHQLRDYIEEVLAVTGKEKVQLASRCLGSNFVAAYFQLYGNDLVQSTVFYVPAVKGVAAAYDGFSGELQFNSDVLDTYTSSGEGVASEMTALLGSVVTVTNQLGILGYGMEFAQSIYDEIKDIIVPELILATFGTMPGFWSSVDGEHYEKAKALIFAGREEEYAGLIEKIDYYHYNVYQNFDETMKKLQKKGLKICVIAKYNVQLVPFLEESGMQSDGDITVQKLAFGATSVKIGETLSREYILKKQLEGNDAYLSKDLIIDASTCLFPDYTWFVKNQAHGDWASCVNSLIYEFLRTDEQLTVWNSKNGYTQFMNYDSAKNKLVPITTSDPGDGNGDSSTDSSGSPTNFLSIIINLLKLILQLFKLI